MEKYLRLIDNENLRNRKNKPNKFWNANSKVMQEYFGELDSKEKLERLYVLERERTCDIHRIPAFLLGLPYNEYIKLMNIDHNYEIKKLDKTKFGNKDGIIYLTGNAGIGKSTYLRYLFGITLKEAQRRARNQGVLKKEIIYFFLDFKNAPPDKRELNKWIETKIKDIIQLKFPELKEPNDQLISTLFNGEKKSSTALGKIIGERAQEIYGNAIMSFYQDPEYFNQKVLNYYIKKGNAKIVFIFDNLDHHYDDDYIKDVIRCAMYQKGKYKCTFILTIREYNLGYTHVIQDMISFILQLSPPNIKSTIQKRFNYTVERLELGRNKVSDDIENPSELLSEDQKIGEEKREGILSLLLSAAGNNVRELLLIINDVFESNYLYNKRKRKIVFSYNSVLKALIYHHNYIFLPPQFDNISRVFNLFENDKITEFGNNFIRVRLLQNLANVNTFRDKNDVIDEVNLLGYNKHSLHKLISEFIRYRLIINIYNSAEQEDKIKITELGIFHLRLYKSLGYLEAMKEATYLPDKVYFLCNSIKLNESKDLFDNRKNEIICFLEYLSSKEKAEFEILQSNIGIFKYLELSKQYLTISELESHYIKSLDSIQKVIEDSN